MSTGPSSPIAPMAKNSPTMRTTAAARPSVIWVGVRREFLRRSGRRTTQDSSLRVVTRPPSVATTVATGALGIVLLAGVTACSVTRPAEIDGGISADASGESTIQRYDIGDRDEVEEFSGMLLDGGSFVSTELAGTVSVVNVWGSWCGPCRIEAPALREVSIAFEDEGVRFLGLNVRDNDAAAIAFEKSFKIPYPSLRSKDSPEASLAFAGQLSTTAVPMTVVLDPEGRIAARVVGQVSEPTLRGLVEDVLAESAD